MIISNLKITTNAIGFEENDDVVILPKHTLNEWIEKKMTDAAMIGFIQEHAKEAFAVISDVVKVAETKR